MAAVVEVVSVEVAVEVVLEPRDGPPPLQAPEEAAATLLPAAQASGAKHLQVAVSSALPILQLVVVDAIPALPLLASPPFQGMVPPVSPHLSGLQHVNKAFLLNTLAYPPHIVVPAEALPLVKPIRLNLLGKVLGQRLTAPLKTEKFLMLWPLKVPVQSLLETPVFQE